jgi:hypothetical protein
MKALPVIPAYGRRYTTAYAAIQAWYCGKDFRIPNGAYLSERDTLKLLADDWTHVHIFDGQEGIVLATLYLGVLGLQQMST